MKMDLRNIGITPNDLFSKVFTENLFHYTQDEVDMLRKLYLLVDRECYLNK